MMETLRKKFDHYKVY